MPVDDPIVATDMLPDVHTPPVVAEDNVEDAPTQMFVVPVMTAGGLETNSDSVLVQVPTR
jgi:hypothetical protein